MEAINLFISSIIKENVVLTKFLGLNFNEKINYIYIVLTTLITGVITYVLNSITKLPFLTFFIATIVIVLITLLLKKINIKTSNMMNTAILGIVILGLDYTLINYIFYILGSLLGLILIYYILSILSKRLEESKLGLESIIFITIGIISIIFTRIS